MEARLEAVIGGMYSGKSTELVNRLRRFELAGKEVWLFKPHIDNRYSNSDVVTHSGLSYQSIAVQDSDELWQQLANRVMLPEVVGVDEVQFFDQGIVEVVEKLVNDHHVRVVVAGLDVDFRAEPWPVMVPLVFLADKVTKLNAVCGVVGCDRDASRTQRLVDGHPVTTGDSVQVGGQEAYQARCRHCYVGRD